MLPTPSPIDAGTIFFEMLGDKFVVMNWYQRSSAQDAAVVIKLGRDYAERYRQLKSQKCSNRRIFRMLFPETEVSQEHKEKQYVPVDISVLTKAQLANLINVALGTSIDSFEKMPIEDLRLIYAALVRTLSPGGTR